MTDAAAPAAPAATEKNASAGPTKGGVSILALVLPAVLSGAAAFGASRLAAAGAHASPASPHAEVVAMRPPGPTLALEAFLIQVSDSSKRVHPTKVVLAVEFDAVTKEDTLKALVPRIRDAILSYFRGLTFEEVTDRDRLEKIRADMLERVHAVGAMTAERVLITDFVSQ